MSNNLQSIIFSSYQILSIHQFTSIHINSHQFTSFQKTSIRVLIPLRTFFRFINSHQPHINSHQFSVSQLEFFHPGSSHSMCTGRLSPSEISICHNCWPCTCAFAETQLIIPRSNRGLPAELSFVQCVEQSPVY